MRRFAMVFSSVIFLFLFLPAVLLIHFLLPARFRNLFLLVSSLLFYAWGEVKFTAVIAASICINYGFGLFIRAAPDQRASLLRCGVGVAANLALLVWFKYANFVVENINAVRGVFGHGPLDWEKIHLPLGISFFVFQGISYVVDVHRRIVDPQRSFVDYAMYKALFPQLIAGPIVRYVDVAKQIASRRLSTAQFAAGIRTFIVGLGKKVLIANAMASGCDAIFALPAAELNGPVAWLGVFFFFMQIAFDFGGYSDMAVGLGRMLGFEFVQNFKHPYISKTLSEFWQRWHISLSTWFRDYLFNPLGGYRCSRARAYANLMTVFILCGLWHGASWNFLFFGLYQGLILLAERILDLRRWKFFKSPAGHLYFLWVISLTMLLFRADDLAQTGVFVRAMYGFAAAAPGMHLVGEFIDRQMLVVILAGILAATPVAPWLGERLRSRPAVRDTLCTAGLALVFIACAMKLAAGTHNPFIYFRF